MLGRLEEFEDRFHPMGVQNIIGEAKVVNKSSNNLLASFPCFISPAENFQFIRLLADIVAFAV